MKSKRIEKKSPLLASVLLIFGVLVIYNVIFLDKFWHFKYLKFDIINNNDSKILMNADRELFVNTYTNFNAEGFSAEKLYENLSQNMKNKYKTFMEFNEYLNQNILLKFKENQYYSILLYDSEEVQSNNSKKIKYTMYLYDLDSYIKVLDDDNLVKTEANFKIDIYLIESGIYGFSIEL